MTPHDPWNRSRPAPTPPQAPREIVTTTGVTVIVNPPPPPAPKLAPPPEPNFQERLPTAIILPQSLTPADREAFMAGLCRQYGPVIDKMLAGWRDITPASADDLRQRVLLILFDKMVGAAPLAGKEVNDWLGGVVRKHVWRRNRNAAHRPQVDREADPDTQLAADDPERAAQVAEEMAGLQALIERLPQKEAEVFQLAELEGMTLDEVAGRLGRPRATVGHQLDRAWVRLKAMAEELNLDAGTGG